MSAPSDRFVVIPLPLLDAPGMALKTYAVLRSYADRDSGEAWPSRKAIATRAGASVDAIDRAVRWLVSEGWIAVEARYSQEGDRTSNRYRVYGSPRPQVAAESPPPPSPNLREGVAAESLQELEALELEPVELDGSPSARPRARGDQVEQVMSDYLNWRGGHVARQVMVKLRTQVADAITSGIPEPVVRQGLADWTEHGQSPISLASFIDGRARGRLPGQKVTRSKTADILAAAETHIPDPAIREMFGLPPVTPDGAPVIFGTALPPTLGAMP